MDAYLAALIEERTGYEQRERSDRVAAVDAEILRFCPELAAIVALCAPADVESVPAKPARPAKKAAL